MSAPSLKLLQRPPAVWLALSRSAAWKDWVIVSQLALLGLLLLANLQLSRQPPDVVLVTPEGKSTYLPRSVAQDSLVRFLDEQKGQPTDLGIVHFTREFLRRVYEVNSSTFPDAWQEALGMMDSSLRDRVAKDAAAQKLLEVSTSAGVRSTVTVQDLVVIDRLPSLVHLKARLARTQSSLIDGSHPAKDEIHVELVARVVPRTQQHPDGLEIISWRANR